MFLVGFILPTVMAFLKRMKMNQQDSFEQYYFYVFIGLILLDILIYLPIFFINRSLVRKNNHKKLLLCLLTARKFEKLILAIYSLSFVFYGLPKDSFEFGINGILTVIKSNILISILSLLTAITSLFSNNKRLINEVSQEVFKTNTKYKKYEYDENSKDVIVKIYKRKNKKSLRYAIITRLITKGITSLVSLATLALLIYLLLTL